jgi:steroid delta-isomerase-like uncharacterized protein
MRWPVALSQDLFILLRLSEGVIVMSHENKLLMRRAVVEIWNQRKFDLLETILAADFVLHAPSQDIHGRDGVKRLFTTLHEAFPDLHFTIEDLVADGDQVVTRWTASGTQVGEFQGIPATHTNVRMSGTDIDRIANGRVTECWTVSDDLGLLQQLGAFPVD